MSRLIHNCQWCGDTLGGDNPCGCPASREIAALKAELSRAVKLLQRFEKYGKPTPTLRDDVHDFLTERGEG